jgi:hypothetical protein
MLTSISIAFSFPSSKKKEVINSKNGLADPGVIIGTRIRRIRIGVGLI